MHLHNHNRWFLREGQHLSKLGIENAKSGHNFDLTMASQGNIGRISGSISQKKLKCFLTIFKAG